MSYISVSESAHPIPSNYLPSRLSVPELPYFQIQMALLAVGEEKKHTQQKHGSASVGAGDAIIWLMMTLNGTIMTW